MRRAVLILAFLFAEGEAAPAFAYPEKSYVPLMQYQASSQLPVEARPTRTGTVTQARGIDPARPALAGVWPKDVELLEDALIRKHGRLLNRSNSKARELILRRYVKSPQSAAQLRGIFAEAVYLGKHPNEGYVKKPNAQHCDVYLLGNGLKCAQIKTKKTFSGSGYEAEMKRDAYARRFIVPDDHVQPLKDYFLKQAQTFETAGDTRLAERARLQSAKIQPLGETSEGLERRLQSVSHRILESKAAPYVSLGVATGLGFAPILWDYANGDVSLERVLYQATRDLSLRMTTLGTESILGKLKDGAWRGSTKGNLITGAALFTVESGFLVYEYGGTKAFREAIFWEEIGGSTSALTLGFAIGTPVAIYVTGSNLASGPAAPFVGAATGFVAGSLSSMIGYFGGKAVTRVWLDKFAPDIARKAERDAVVEARAGLDGLEKKAIAYPASN